MQALKVSPTQIGLKKRMTQSMKHCNISPLMNECDGRLIGTEGNKKAKEYIVSKFKDFSIEPYNNSFYHPYSQQISVIDSDKMILDLKDTKGNTIKFEYGKDFMVSSICPGTSRLPISFDAAGEEDCILVAKGYKDENIKNLMSKVY